MTGDLLPDEDHVTRLCGFAQLNEDGTPDGSAFVLKPSETYLSVNWLEILGLANRSEEIAEVLHVLGTKRKIGKSAKLALLNVGRSRFAVRAGPPDGLDIHLRHQPELISPADPSHAGIYGLPSNAGGNLAAECRASSVLQVTPAR